MTNITETIEKLLFLSEEICEIFDELFILTKLNKEESSDYNDLIECLDNYLSQETAILDSLNKNELTTLLLELYKMEINNDTTNSCYVAVRYYFKSKYPYEFDVIEEMELSGLEEDENDEENEESLLLEYEYEDEEDATKYHNYVVLKIAITAIKKMYHHIKNTETDNKIDHQYKKALLKYFKLFKYEFFSLNRDAEALGIKYRFNVNAIPEMSKPNANISSICFNECVDLLDELYFTKDSERDLEIISLTLFNMLCFDEYIKELSPEQVDKLINICTAIEEYKCKNLYGNIGLQKLVKIKKTRN